MPLTLGVGVKRAFGSGKDLAVEAVESPDDLAADLEVARLVLPHRHERRAVDGDVRRHEHRVAEEPVCPEVPGAELLDLVLVGRHALEPAEGRDHREVERELGVLGDARLQEDRRLLRVEADGQPVEHGFARVVGQGRRVGIVRRQRVEVRDEEEAAVLAGVLQVHPVLDGAEVVAEVDPPGRTQPREDRVGHQRPPKTSAIDEELDGPEDPAEHAGSRSGGSGSGTRKARAWSRAGPPARRRAKRPRRFRREAVWGAG